MNSKLALELNEAGFPKDELSTMAFPELAELIEACGNDFGSLNKYGEVFDAEPPQEGKIGAWSGSTPEEAVAKLWMAINKKDNANT